MLQDVYGHEIGSLYTFVPINVAGVTFSNGRRSRQTILRKVHWHDDPYTKTDAVINLSFRKVDFEGEPAIEIYIEDDNGNYEQIGYVPKAKVSYFCEHWDLYDSSFAFKVYGGGTRSDGTDISYGCSFTLRFRNSPENQRLYDESKRKEEEEKRREEEKQRPYKRAFELFCLDYPEIDHGGYVVTNTDAYISVNVLNRSKGTQKLKPIYQVIYYPEEDTITAFDYNTHVKLPVRSHTHKKTKPHKRIILWITLVIAACFILGWLTGGNHP